MKKHLSALSVLSIIVIASLVFVSCGPGGAAPINVTKAQIDQIIQNVTNEFSLMTYVESVNFSEEQSRCVVNVTKNATDSSGNKIRIRTIWGVLDAQFLANENKMFPMTVEGLEELDGNYNTYLSSANPTLRYDTAVAIPLVNNGYINDPDSLLFAYLDSGYGDILLETADTGTTINATFTFNHYIYDFEFQLN
jgi:hypothetical protein